MCTTTAPGFTTVAGDGLGKAGLGDRGRTAKTGQSLLVSACTPHLCIPTWSLGKLDSAPNTNWAAPGSPGRDSKASPLQSDLSSLSLHLLHSPPWPGLPELDTCVFWMHFTQCHPILKEEDPAVWSSQGTVPVHDRKLGSRA